MPLIPSHQSRHAAPMFPDTGAVHGGSENLRYPRDRHLIYGPIKPREIGYAALDEFCFDWTAPNRPNGDMLLRALFHQLPLRSHGWAPVKTDIVHITRNIYGARRRP